MLAGGGICPLAGGAFAGHIASQPHKHGAASGVPDIADLPIVAATPAVGEIVTAYRLRFTREAICQLGDMSPHGHAAVRSEIWKSDGAGISREGLNLIFRMALFMSDSPRRAAEKLSRPPTCHEHSALLSLFATTEA